jgi:hypothetical protein
LAPPMSLTPAEAVEGLELLGAAMQRAMQSGNRPEGHE